MLVNNTVDRWVSILSGNSVLGQKSSSSSSDLGDSVPSISKHMPKNMIVTLLNKATEEKAARGELKGSYTTLKDLQVSQKSKDSAMYRDFELEITKLTQELESVKQSTSETSTSSTTVYNTYNTIQETDSSQKGNNGVDTLQKLGVNLQSARPAINSIDAKKFLDSLTRLKKLSEEVINQNQGSGKKKGDARKHGQRIVDTVDNINQLKFRKSMKYLNQVTAALENHKENQSEESLKRFQDLFNKKKVAATVKFVRNTVRSLHNADVRESINETKKNLSGNNLAAFNTSAFYIDQSSRALDKGFFSGSITTNQTIIDINKAKGKKNSGKAKNLDKSGTSNKPSKANTHPNPNKPLAVSKNSKPLSVKEKQNPLANLPQSKPYLSHFQKARSSISQVNLTEDAKASLPSHLKTDNQNIVTSVESYAAAEFSHKREIKSHSKLSKFKTLFL